MTQTNGPKVLGTVTPPRSLAKDSLLTQYHKLLDAACQLEDSLRVQEESLSPRMRRSLHPKMGHRKIKAMVACADLCLEYSTKIDRVDEDGKYVLEYMPPLPGVHLLPRQDLAFLGNLGWYHWLYIGKYKRMYGGVGR